MPDVAGFAEALDLHKAGRLDEAEQGYREVLRADPRHAAAWKMLGILARDVGRLRESIAFLEEGLHAVGPEPKLYFHLGQSYRAVGDADGAIRSFRLSLTLDEANPEGHLALGNLLLARSERHAAIEHFSRAVELAPDAIEPRFSLAVALDEDGQTAAAEAAYRELLAIEADHAGALINFGVLLQEQGQLAEAIDSFRRARRPAIQLEGPIQSRVGAGGQSRFRSGGGGLSASGRLAARRGRCPSPVGRSAGQLRRAPAGADLFSPGAGGPARSAVVGPAGRMFWRADLRK